MDDAARKTIEEKDTIPPIISRMAARIDTAYLNTTYKSSEIEALDEVNGVLRCTNIPVRISGTPDTRFPGTYVLTYNATDHAGNEAVPVEFTVHVVENPAGFLSGSYNVISTCSTISGVSVESVGTETYIANVETGTKGGEFFLSALKIGPEYVAHSTTLRGHAIDVSYFSTSYHTASSATGTLSASKNSFTIDAKAYQFYPAVKYLCRNVYTKQLVLKE